MQSTSTSSSANANFDNVGSKFFVPLDPCALTLYSFFGSPDPFTFEFDLPLWAQESQWLNVHHDGIFTPPGTTLPTVLPEILPSESAPRRRREVRRPLTEQQRHEYLQNERFVESFSGAWVTCALCHRGIKAGRSGEQFDLGNWLRHRRRCEVMGSAEKRLERNRDNLIFPLAKLTI